MIEGYIRDNPRHGFDQMYDVLRHRGYGKSRLYRVYRQLKLNVKVDEIQRDLDRLMRYYNLERSHQGYRLKGRTPAQALMEAFAVREIPEIVPTEEAIEPLPMAA